LFLLSSPHFVLFFPNNSIDQRCPPLENAVPALDPGALNKMFERIVAVAPGNRTLTEAERQELRDKEMTEYSVVVLSRPSEEPVTDISSKNDKLPPWIIVVDDFVSDEECDAMIQLGYEHEYKRSADVGALKFDGTHESVESRRRTSENAWCSEHNGCRNETVPTRLHKRMSQVMEIPPENSEDFQILKYEKGQFYRTHHVSCFDGRIVNAQSSYTAV
jgi:prolyl 4-hydroxylase